MSAAVAEAEISRIIARNVIVNEDILVNEMRDLPKIGLIARNINIASERTLALLKAYELSLYGVNVPVALSKELFEIAIMVVIGSKLYRPRASEGEAQERTARRLIYLQQCKELLREQLPARARRRRHV